MSILLETLLHTSAQLLEDPAGSCLGTESMGVCLQHEKFQSAPGSRVGTPAYLAPEVIMTTKGQTYDGKVDCCWIQPRPCVSICHTC